jgi:hypothetical protein
MIPITGSHDNGPLTDTETGWVGDGARFVVITSSPCECAASRRTSDHSFS